MLKGSVIIHNVAVSTTGSTRLAYFKFDFKVAETQNARGVLAELDEKGGGTPFFLSNSANRPNLLATF
jgi:hypothetical protein